MTEKELIQLKEEITEAKSKMQQLEGQRSAWLKQLKEKFDCKNLKEAEKKLTLLQKKQDKYEEEIKEQLEEIEKLLP